MNEAQRLPQSVSSNDEALMRGLRLCLEANSSAGLPTNKLRDPATRIEFFREALRAAREITSSHRPAELQKLDQLVGPLVCVIKTLASSNRMEDIESAVRIWVVMFREYTELQRVELEAATACFRAFMQFEYCRAEASK